ncbi:hypothetical protein DSL72_009198 [Monilinia vaccinii-corymbosi]|uniref:Uncharacterized protein n=1 Tax=Monilinia vaccinii-corymbosi TaxID=61207 RepID=A0A8A3PQN6_9HELO|nr:hypothetical protein DSL72_009198 [Monilinia vaccinii-corymbosi]
MDNDCGCSSRARPMSKAPILTGDYDISWNSMSSIASRKDCNQDQKTDFASTFEPTKSSTTSESSYLRSKESDHYYGDLDLTRVVSSPSCDKSPYLYKKQTLLAKAAAPIPHRSSSLAFRSLPKNLERMGSMQKSIPSLIEASGPPEFSCSLSCGCKHLEHVQKLLEDIRIWHKEVSISISRSHTGSPKDCHQSNVNILPSQDSHKQKTYPLESTLMDSLRQNSWRAQVFNGGYTTPRGYTSRSVCPRSNVSPTWKIDPIPSSIYKPKLAPNTWTRRSPRPIPSPRTSSIGATIVPRRRNAVRGRILPKKVSVICPTMKLHSYEARFTERSSTHNINADGYLCCDWDRESTLTGKEENSKIDTIHFPTAAFAQPELSTVLQDQPSQDSQSQIHEDGLAHSDTVIRLSARHSSLQASDPAFESPPWQEGEEEEEARSHIAFVHSALRNLVPFEVSDYLYRVSQSSETSDDSLDGFLDGFAVTTPSYIKSTSGYQSSETLGQDGLYNPGDSFYLKKVPTGNPPQQFPDKIGPTKTWAPGTAI